MRNDDVWEVDRPHLVHTTPQGDAHVKDLKRHAIKGGFTPGVYRALRHDPALAGRIAESLVAEHFPTTRQDAVLEAVGVEEILASEEVEFISTRRRRRDPMFRHRILQAYGARCAVCAFAGHLGDAPLALEAAHIKWHQAEGPAVVDNGLALCALHHELFDAGAFTVLPELKVVVASVVAGRGIEEALRRYHGDLLRAPPLVGFPKPAPRFLAWHQSEVFKGGARARIVWAAIRTAAMRRPGTAGSPWAGDPLA